MTSNYPPGVTGTEPQIVGDDEYARAAAHAELLSALGGLIAGLHVPRSLASIAVPREYDTVRGLINDFGYSTGSEIADRLRRALDIEDVEHSDVCDGSDGCGETLGVPQ